MGRATLDSNFRSTLIGVDHVGFLTPTEVAVNSTTHELLTVLSGPTTTNSHTGNQEIRVFQENHICTQNTTATPLGAGATFTGQWQDCLNYQEVNVSIVSDQNSATNGLVFQWSDDGVIIGDTDVFSYYTANGGTNYTPNPSFRYVRMVYTNGSTPQTTFHLMTILRRSVTGGSFHRIDSTLRDDQDGRLQIVVPKLRTAQNNYITQTATSGGNAKVSVEEVANGVSIPVASYPYSKRIDDTTTTSVTYIGVAAVGSSEGSAVWKIYAIDESSANNVTIKYADGNANFDNIWSNRSSLTYS